MMMIMMITIIVRDDDDILGLTVPANKDCDDKYRRSILCIANGV